MFYILVSRIPFIYNIDNKKDKLFRTFLIGSICYIILHGFLYSKKFTGNNFVEKYRSYLMYLAGIDFTLTSGIIYTLDKKQVQYDEENAYIEVEGVDDDIENSVDVVDNRDKKLTREEILQNFYNNKTQEKPSPFISKVIAEEIKENEKKSQSSKNNSQKNITETKNEIKSNHSEINNLVALESDTELPLYKSE